MRHHGRRAYHSPHVRHHYRDYYHGYGYRYHHYPRLRLHCLYPSHYYERHYKYYHSYPWFYGSVRIHSVPSVVVESAYTDPMVVQEVPLHVSEQRNLIDTVLRAGADERAAAAMRLRDYKNIASVAALIDVLINDGSGTVRAAAAESLGEIGEPAAYEALVRCAVAEEDERVRGAADQAIEKIHQSADDKQLYLSPRMPPMNQGKAKLPEHLEDLRYGDRKTRNEAADDLEKYRGTQAVAALIDVLINDPSDEVREQAAESLGKIGDRMAVPFLRWARYNDLDDSVRDEAEEAIDKVYDTIQ